MNLSFCVRLFQLSLNKDERERIEPECVGLTVQDCFSCRLTRMNAGVLVFLCKTVSIVAPKG